LYFVARDGQILHRIAELICARLGLSIECRYLYGSRQSWCLPGAVDVGAFEREWMLMGLRQHTLDDILARCGLTRDAVQPALDRAGLANRREGARLSASDQVRIEALFDDDEFLQALKRAAAAQRGLALSYFHNQGLLDQGPFGIVDIGWNGRLQRALARMLTDIDPDAADRLHGFYLGLSKRQPENEAGQQHAFCDGAPIRLARAGYRYPALLEVFCALPRLRRRRCKPACASRSRERGRRQSRPGDISQCAFVSIGLGPAIAKSVEARSPGLGDIGDLMVADMKAPGVRRPKRLDRMRKKRPGALHLADIGRDEQSVRRALQSAPVKKISDNRPAQIHVRQKGYIGALCAGGVKRANHLRHRANARTLKFEFDIARLVSIARRPIHRAGKFAVDVIEPRLAGA
ncbi:MAG: hypothetical protein AAGL49_09725, partial [Pseudomonadota bacterium]